MSHKHNEASRKFHDRVAPRYDAIYDDPYWEFHDRLTWQHLKTFVPKATNTPTLDLGCGTGKWGFKLLKAGHPTTFSDLSNGMLEEVRNKLTEWAKRPDLASKAAKATVVQADAVDLHELPAGHFGLITAMGDVVSICSDPAKCLSEVQRLLKPDGVFVFTVDNRLAALEHFIDSGNLDALSGFVKTGSTHWLTASTTEQFQVHMFLPAQIEALARSRGFEVISRIGKTILPVRHNKRFFETEGALERILDLELFLAKDPSALARASHLQLAVKRVSVAP